jgi:hypothetical protein
MVMSTSTSHSSSHRPLPIPNQAALDLHKHHLPTFSVWAKKPSFHLGMLHTKEMMFSLAGARKSSTICRKKLQYLLSK